MGTYKLDKGAHAVYTLHYHLILVVKVPGIKAPVTITFVGPTVLGKGIKGGRYGFVQNDYDKKIYCLTPKMEKIVMDIHTEQVDFTHDTIESKGKQLIIYTLR